MLLTRIGKTSFRFKVSTADRIFSASNTRSYSTLETIVISKKLAIRTRNLMQSPNLVESFSQCYRNTPQKQNHHSCDTETANKNSHRCFSQGIAEGSSATDSVTDLTDFRPFGEAKPVKRRKIGFSHSDERERRARCDR